MNQSRLGEAPPVDEDEVRRTAYFLWEADGRPDGNAEHYWWSALERVARAKSSDSLLGRDIERGT